MHVRDTVLVESIQYYFGGIGYISNPTSSSVEFRVSSIKSLVDIIFPHFDKYPLKSQKYSDYVLFKQIVLLMLGKEHNNLKGLQKIVNLKASLNSGLYNGLKIALRAVTLNLQGF